VKRKAVIVDAVFVKAEFVASAIGGTVEGAEWTFSNENSS